MPKSEDQQTWEILVQFWRGQSYNRWGQLSNGHRNKHSPEYKSYTDELRALEARGFVVYNAGTRHWEWTKAGAEWCNEFIARQHKE